MISLLVAASENNAIGKNGKLLWNLPNDLKYFKNLTWAMVVVMGRKTYEAIDKPLPGRVNIVITRKADWKREGVQVAKDIDEALLLANATNCKEIFVIGGGEIYKEFMPKADRIYMTRVHAEFDADTFFPEISLDNWTLISAKKYEADEKHKYSYTFEIWDKI